MQDADMFHNDNDNQSSRMCHEGQHNDEGDWYDHVIIVAFHIEGKVYLQAQVILDPTGKIVE